MIEGTLDVAQTVMAMPACEGAAAPAAQQATDKAIDKATDKAGGGPAGVSADTDVLRATQLVLVIKDAFRAGKAAVAQCNRRTAPPQQLLFRRRRYRQPPAVKCPALPVTKPSDLAAPVTSAGGAAS